MPKGLYIGVSNVARKAKKAYVGVNNVARKVKKVYIGVNGVARLAWSGAFLSKYTGAVSPLTEVKWNACSASNGTYAIFAGGIYSYYYGDTTYYTMRTSVDAYNSSLVKTVAPALTYGRDSSNGKNGARVGQYAYFGLGENFNGYSVNYANAYNQALVRVDFEDIIPTIEQSVQQNDLNNPTYAICGYGFYNNGTSPYNPQGQHYGINSSLVKSYFYDNAVLRSLVGVACVGGQVLIAGGDDQPLTMYSNGADLKDIVSAFNSSYVKTSLSVLSSKRGVVKGICNNNYALFVGGRGAGNNPVSTIDVYNSSLVKLTPLDFGNAEAGEFNYAQSPEFALTPAAAKSYDDIVYGFDTSLVRTVAGTSSIIHPRGATVGDYIVFGGFKGAVNYDTVDVFKTT